MHKEYKGTCKCGNVDILVNLPLELSAYSPRTCNCDYCKKRELTVISDVCGSIKVTSRIPLRIERQGSNQADFRNCSKCGDFIIVSYSYSDCCKGAVNAALLSSIAAFKRPTPISTKLLSSSKKLQRWKTVWSEVSYYE